MSENNKKTEDCVTKEKTISVHKTLIMTGLR